MATIAFDQATREQEISDMPRVGSWLDALQMVVATHIDLVAAEEVVKGRRW